MEGWRGHHAAGVPRRLPGLLAGRLAVAGLRHRGRRPGSAGRTGGHALREPERRQPRLDHGARPAARCLRVHQAPRLARAEGTLPGEGRDRRMAGHHVPDGTARGVRPRPVPHQGGSAGRRALRVERHQDLHLRRRTRPDRQHRAPGAGAPARQPARSQGPVAVPDPEVLRGRFQKRRGLRAHRGKDGPARQPDLRDAF